MKDVLLKLDNRYVGICYIYIVSLYIYLSMFDIVYNKIYKSKEKGVKERLMKVIYKGVGKG